MLSSLKSRLVGQTRIRGIRRARLRRAEWPVAIYAIGDIHGCLRQLIDIERSIVADASAYPGNKLIVTLGDYIDRGPNAAGVLDHLLAPPPPGFERICLAGNHEEMLLDCLAVPRWLDDWLDLGADTTLRSYGMDPSRLAGLRSGQLRSVLRAHIPQVHLDFLAELPIALALPGIVFVHAGLRPGVALERQAERDLQWLRPNDEDDVPSGGELVVHGHTPGERPVLKNHRVCIDTACFATGRLTAIRLGRDSRFRIIQT